MIVKRSLLSLSTVCIGSVGSSCANVFGLAGGQIHHDFLGFGRAQGERCLSSRQENLIVAFLEQNHGLLGLVNLIARRQFPQFQRNLVDNDVSLGLVEPGEVKLNVILHHLVLSRIVVAVRARFRGDGQANSVASLVHVEALLVLGVERAIVASQSLRRGTIARRQNALLLHQQQRLLVLIGQSLRRAVVVGRVDGPLEGLSAARSRAVARLVVGGDNIVLLAAQSVVVLVLGGHVLHELRVIARREVAVLAVVFSVCLLQRAIQRSGGHLDLLQGSHLRLLRDTLNWLDVVVRVMLVHVLHEIVKVLHRVVAQLAAVLVVGAVQH